MVRRATACAFVLVLLTACSAAFADGKGFAPRTGGVGTADQRAVVVWEGDRQRLVIETGFHGDHEEVAWLVPVPGVPEIEQATRGLLPTMEQVMAVRRVEGDSAGWLIGAIILWLMGLVGLYESRVLGEVLTRWAVGGLLVVTLVGVLGAMLLPSLGKSLGTVTLHDRQVVGAYEVATLEAESAEAVLGWLEENGFAAPAGAEAVIGEYVAEGWVFVAAKVRRMGEADELLRPHPLTLTFATERCVYPMRLTGVDQDEALTVELFVLAREAARADGFEQLAVLRGESEPSERMRGMPRTDGVLSIRTSIFASWRLALASRGR